MVIDTSVLVSILHDEPEAAQYSRAIEAEARCHLSAASYVELGVVMDRAKDPFVSGRVDALIEKAGIHIVSLTESQALIARSAYQRFGKGSGHPARLNLGDCFSYALAMQLGHPLLFKGQGFAQTDVAPALS